MELFLRNLPLSGPSRGRVFEAIALGLELSVGLMLPRFIKNFHEFSTFAPTEA